MDIVHRESNVGEESDLYPRVYCICCWIVVMVGMLQCVEMHFPVYMFSLRICINTFHIHLDLFNSK